MEEASIDLVRRLKVALLPWQAHITEKKMFGGYCFLYKGKMCVGETKGRLMVRVTSKKITDVMKLPKVKPMNFTGKPMKEFIFVHQGGFNTEETLQHFIELGIEHATIKATK